MSTVPSTLDCNLGFCARLSLLDVATLESQILASPSNDAVMTHCVSRGCHCILFILQLCPGKKRTAELRCCSVFQIANPPSTAPVATIVGSNGCAETAFAAVY